MTVDSSSNVPSNNNIPDRELELRRLELDEKKSEQKHQIRLREVGLKEAEIFAPSLSCRRIADKLSIKTAVSSKISSRSSGMGIPAFADLLFVLARAKAS
jgi:hypothetical protein